MGIIIQRGKLTVLISKLSHCCIVLESIQFHIDKFKSKTKVIQYQKSGFYLAEQLSLCGIDLINHLFKLNVINIKHVI